MRLARSHYSLGFLAVPAHSPALPIPCKAIVKDSLTVALLSCLSGFPLGALDYLA